MVKSQINQSQKIPEENYDRTLISNLATLAQKWLKNCRAKKKIFFGLCHSLLMVLGQDQQHHPTVHSWGGSRGMVCGYGCWHH
jgi:hypothetical protein